MTTAITAWLIRRRDIAAQRWLELQGSEHARETRTRKRLMQWDRILVAWTRRGRRHI